MSKSKLKEIYNLSKNIANKLNEINHNVFTKSEVMATIKDYMYMILSNDKDQIIDTLQDEITNGNYEVANLYNDLLLI